MPGGLELPACTSSTWTRGPSAARRQAALDTVRATGNLVAANRYTRVEAFHVRDGDCFRTVWTDEAQEATFRERLSRFDAVAGYDVRTGSSNKRR